MDNTLTFRLRRVIGTQPDFIPEYATVFNAPRPLYGTACDEIGLMGFSVYVDTDTYGREGFIRENLANDAQVIEWVPEHKAKSLALEYVVAEYGDETAADCEAEVLLDVWQQVYGQDKVRLEV